MSPDATDLSSSVTLPRWMVWVGITLIGFMGMVVVGAWTTDRTQLNTLSNRQADTEGRLSAMEVKHSDFIAMFNKLNSSVDSMDRKLDLLEAHLRQQNKTP